MLTETKTENVLDVPYSDTEYPQELMDLWDRETERMKMRIASGEVKFKSVREVAAEHGVILN